MAVEVWIRLYAKVDGRQQDIGIKYLERDPVRGEQFKFEHDGRTIRARVGSIFRPGAPGAAPRIDALEI